MNCLALPIVNMLLEPKNYLERSPDSEQDPHLGVICNTVMVPKLLFTVSFGWFRGKPWFQIWFWLYLTVHPTDPRLMVTRGPSSGQHSARMIPPLFPAMIPSLAPTEL